MAVTTVIENKIKGLRVDNDRFRLVVDLERSECRLFKRVPGLVLDFRLKALGVFSFDSLIDVLVAQSEKEQ